MRRPAPILNEIPSETFTYDNLNRVTSATVSQSVAPVKTFAYDAIGNMLSKSDVGAYAYPLVGCEPARTKVIGAPNQRTLHAKRPLTCRGVADGRNRTLESAQPMIDLEAALAPLKAERGKLGARGPIGRRRRLLSIQ